MNETTQNNHGAKAGVFRPSLAFYHANQRGTGSALRMTLHPAHDVTDGSIMASFANQATVGGGHGQGRTFSTFDWENNVCVKLDFADLCRMLQVFRGECEMLEDGKGLYHRSPSGSVKIQLRHQLEPMPGYSFSVSKTMADASERKMSVFLTPWEALGLSESIASSLGVICFGIPMVIEHDTAAYRREAKEVRNGFAA